MKKIALTFVALAFGSCVAFAQSTPQASVASTENTVHTLTLDKMSNRVEERAEKADRRALSVYELPEMVLEQLKYSELAGHTVISVMEVQPLSGDDVSLQYELLLQDGPTQTSAEPRLLVRFDEYGELVSRKEISLMAQQEK